MAVCRVCSIGKSDRWPLPESRSTSVGAGGLPNQMRDLRVLQELGSTFGSTLPGRERYERTFERISGTLEICRLEAARPSVWWDGWGTPMMDSENYEKGRNLFTSAMGL